MLRNPFTKWLWDIRRSLVVWTVAISTLGGFYAALWPTLADPKFQEALESYPQALLESLNYDDISTPAGYLTATVYGLVTPVLLIIFGVAAGSRAIAGDEQAGNLELVAAHPVSRSRLALQRMAGIGASLAVICGVLAVVMILLRGPGQFTEIGVGGLLAMHVQLLLFSVLFAALAFAVGAATGSRSLALGSSAGVAVAGYLATGLMQQVDGLKWAQELSPFHWLVDGDPLRNGVPLGHSSTLIAVTACLITAGSWGFTQRDLAV